MPFPIVRKLVITLLFLFAYWSSSNILVPTASLASTTRHINTNTQPASTNSKNYITSVDELTITSPVARMVFQRNLDNQATILVTGMAPPAVTTIEARVVPLAIGQGSVSAWTSLNRISGSTTFRGTITAQAGWYRLDVRAKTGTALIAQTQVNRIGVGEVFIVAGQSNAFGGFQRPPNSVEDRVMTLDFRQDSLSEQLLPLRFSNVSYGTNIGPSQPPHIWGPLGDKLVQRLNVPVLFLGAALGGTTSSEWQQSAAGNIGTTPNPAVYRRLGAVLLHYALRTGVRAVLWHQGEGRYIVDHSAIFQQCQVRHREEPPADGQPTPALGRFPRELHSGPNESAGHCRPEPAHQQCAQCLCRTRHRLPDRVCQPI